MQTADLSTCIFLESRFFQATVNKLSIYYRSLKQVFNTNLKVFTCKKTTSESTWDRNVTSKQAGFLTSEMTPDFAKQRSKLCTSMLSCQEAILTKWYVFKIWLLIGRPREIQCNPNDINFFNFIAILTISLCGLLSLETEHPEPATVFALFTIA